MIKKNVSENFRGPFISDLKNFWFPFLLWKLWVNSIKKPKNNNNKKQQQQQQQQQQKYVNSIFFCQFVVIFFKTPYKVRN